MVRFLTNLQTAWKRRRLLQEFKSTESDDRELRSRTFRYKMLEALDVYETDNFRRAVEVWEQAAVMYPEQCHQSDLAIKLLLKLKRHEELAGLMQRGLKKNSHQPMYLEALAQSAYDQDKLVECENYCSQLQRKFPNHVIGYLLAAASLSRRNKPDDAEIVIKRALSILPSDVRVLIEYAKLAERRNDTAAAFERWDALYQRTGHAAGLAGSVKALADLRRFDDADGLIEDVRYKFGTQHLVWISHARVAEIKGDWVEARKRWAFYRRRFPRLAYGFIEGVEPLKRLQLLDELETVLAEGVESVPDEPRIIIDYATMAHQRGDWDKAVARWTLVRERFPDVAEAITLGAEALKALNTQDKAQNLQDSISEAIVEVKRPPPMPEDEWAITFGKSGNALEHCTEGWSDPEGGFTWTIGHQASLLLPPPKQNSDYIISVTVHNIFVPEKRKWQRFGISVNGNTLCSLLLEKAGMIKAWLPASIVSPGSGQMRLQLVLPDASRPSDWGANKDSRMLGIAVSRLTLSRLGNDAEDDDANHLSEIGWETESLGSNCCYGLVQRRAGAEPLGLLRWSTSQLRSLVPALGARFSGLGDPQSMNFTIHGTGGDAQWMMLDQIYGFVFHTFTHPDKATEDEIRRRESRRIPRLATKLLEDLEEGKKLFVYQGTDATNPDDANSLLEAISRYGDATLLLVLPDPSKVGHAYQAADRLIVGYINAIHPLADPDVADWESWKVLLRNVYPIHKAAC